MQNTMKINDQVTVGPQPSAEEITELRQQGFKTVINFRTEDEENLAFSPSEEAERVKAERMAYRNFPVSMKTMSPEKVDEFRENYSKLPKPVYAHCKSGKRAGAMVMMQMAVDQGMSGEQILQNAEEMGFECDNEELRKFVKDYVENRSS